jgi:hypothetical protein
LDTLACPLDSGLVDVAQRRDVGRRDLQVEIHVVVAAPAETDDSDGDTVIGAQDGMRLGGNGGRGR